MLLVLNDIFNDEIKDYLLDQDGLLNVSFSAKDYIPKINIKHDNRISPRTILKHIEVFQGTEYSSLMEFDKGFKGDFNTLKYLIDDMCCDYCYRGLVEDLFDSSYIKSVKSDFSLDKPAFNVNFVIEYDKNYSEEELINYIHEKYQ